MDIKPMKWAEVREHYMEHRKTGQKWKFTCVHCCALISVRLKSTAAQPLRDHLTERHADKLAVGREGTSERLES